ncbi:MAG: hypothetical protein CMJ39_05090 [Phycisphaerae bacterium]|nr:hypothetical protein [Phycisphaerae bacterium]
MSMSDIANSPSPALPALQPHRHSWKRISLRILLLLAIVGGVAALYFYVLEPDMGKIDAFVEELGGWGPVVYVGIFFIATTIFLPESIIAIAAGTLFGLWWGWLWVVVAGVITSAFTFAVVRLFLRERIERLLKKYPKAYAVEQATGHAGFKVIFLLRLAPVNYSLLNYLAAVSPCSFRSYMIACIGMIPGNFSTVYMGFVAKHTSDLARQLKADPHHLAHGDSMVHEITVYGGLVVSIIASLVVARVAVKAIHRETAKQAALDGDQVAQNPI